MIALKKLSLIFACSLLVFSCTNEGSEDNSDVLNTPTEIIETTNQPENSEIIPTLIADLKSQKFELENREIQPMNSFYNWKEDIQFVIEGNGMKAYYFKRTEAKPANYYPDFTLSVFQFKNEADAESCFNKIELAAQGGHKSRGRIPQKNPQTITQKGKEVFFLSTRAEMFRGYIDDCAEGIQSYPEH